ncbi:hypothetical protein AB1Y20_001179 [Prymnesium parvum]|uniref:DNA-PKcs N-terminal domain-containing protein n=1 Tax=Prymnesium parvum TaxID=97485 RepID=A0AB34K7G7_PRYPA
MEDFAPPIRSHLDDLTALATGRMSGAGLSAKDSSVSIENVCRNLLDEQVAGAASLLFDKTAGLPAIIWMSMNQKERGNPSLVELRGEIMRLIEWIFDDFTGRELQHQLGEYVVEVVRTCMRLFPVETTTKNKDLTFGPLLAALEQREHVPDPHELRVLLFPPDRTLSPIEKYWDHLTKQKSAKEQTETLRGQCMRFLGRLAMFFPVDVSLVPIYNNRQLYRSYEAALCQEGTGLPELAGALDGLDGLLSYIEIDRADTSKLFSSLLHRLDRWVDNDDIKRYNVPRAVMRVLANHMPHFAAANLLMPSEATHVKIRENLESSLIYSSARRIWELLHPLSLHHNAEMQHQASG